MCPIDIHLLRRTLYKFQDLFSSPPPPVPDGRRTVAVLPDAGRRVSVETALNSRCCSDADGNPRRFHWGMFDTASKLPPEIIGEIAGRARAVPGLSADAVDILVEGEVLTCVIDGATGGLNRERLMIESGMQQQAVGLLCAALGVGMVFKSLGDDGVAISGGQWATTRIRLGPMKTSYGGAYWTSRIPSGSRPWVAGNLPEPLREGRSELLAVLERLALSRTSGQLAGMPQISQLLWAARGRTPHFYKSEPWGMTIPTSRGEQNVSSLYLASVDGLSRYVNWRNNRPTHSLEPVASRDQTMGSRLSELFPGCRVVILLAANENRARALWEVGYQLLNLLLQAAALDVPHEAAFLDSDQKAGLGAAGISTPIAAFVLRHTPKE